MRSNDLVREVMALYGSDLLLRVVLRDLRRRSTDGNLGDMLAALERQALLRARRLLSEISRNGWELDDRPTLLVDETQMQLRLALDNVPPGLYRNRLVAEAARIIFEITGAQYELTRMYANAQEDAELVRLLDEVGAETAYERQNLADFSQALSPQPQSERSRSGSPWCLSGWPSRCGRTCSQGTVSTMRSSI